MTSPLPRLTLLLCLSLPLYAVGQAESECGSLEWNYGPYDYRAASAQQRKLVEARHLNADRFGISIEDVEYALNVFPNHPRALLLMEERARQAKANRAPKSKRTVDCWYERAMRFKPDDLIPRLFYVNYLIQQNKLDEARPHLAYVAEKTVDDPLTQFNVGMLYADMKDYDKALVQAHRVIAMGYDRRELRDRLTAVGKWVEPAPTADAASAPASSASQ